MSLVLFSQVKYNIMKPGFCGDSLLRSGVHSAPRVVSVFVASFGLNHSSWRAGTTNIMQTRPQTGNGMCCRVRGKDVDWLIDGKIRWALGRKDVLN